MRSKRTVNTPFHYFKEWGRPLGGILGPLKSDVGVFWAKIPLYPYNVKFSNSIFSKSPNFRILSFWILNLHIIICQFQKRSTVKHFLSLTPCSCYLWHEIHRRAWGYASIKSETGQSNSPWHSAEFSCHMYACTPKLILYSYRTKNLCRIYCAFMHHSLHVAKLHPRSR